MKKDVNMELLRVVAMYFIVLIHLLGKTMAIDKMIQGSFAYYIAWIVEGIIGMGNNLFILISGYFFLETRFRLSKFINLYTETLFYSIVFYLISMRLGIELQSGWKRVIFPIINEEYWFVSVYIVLYSLTPYIKIYIDKINQKVHLSLLSIIFLVFSVIPTISQKQWIGGVQMELFGFFSCIC